METVPALLSFNRKAVPGRFDLANSSFHPDQTLGEAEIIELDESVTEVAIKTSDAVIPCGIAGVDWSGIVHVTFQLPPEGNALESLGQH